MANIYVGGRVLREGEFAPPKVLAAYDVIGAVAASTDTKARLPKGEPRLDRMQPPEFVDEIRKRIAASDAVIIVHAADDPSAAVESTIAALSGKRHLVVVEQPGLAPRLVQGLPGIVRVIPIDSPDLKAAIRQFIESTGEITSTA